MDDCVQTVRWTPGEWESIGGNLAVWILNIKLEVRIKHVGIFKQECCIESSNLSLKSFCKH